VALAAIPSSAKALEVRCLSNVLHISTATVQLGSLTSSSFTLLLPLDSSGILPTFSLNYDPLLYEAPSKFILSSPPSIPHTTVDPSNTRRLMNSIGHHIVRQHRDRCLRFLTNRYPTLEAAQGSKWYQQYRAAEVRIDRLQSQA
jgi:hypothetical protein